MFYSKRWVFAFILLTAACAHHPAPVSMEPPCPPWSRGGAHPDYPSDVYLLGLGLAGNAWTSAHGEEAARASALRGLSEQLLARVEGSIHSQEWSQGGGYGQSLQSSARVETAFTLPGAEIVDRCYDAAHTTSYALAAISRERLKDALNVMYEHGMAEAERAKEDMERALEAEERHLALERGRAGETACAESQQLASVLRGMGEAPGDGGDMCRALKRTVDELVASVCVEVALRGNPSFRSYLESLLSEGGLRTCGPLESPTWGLSINVTAGPVTRSAALKGVVVAQAEGSATILGEAGQPLETHQVTAQASSNVRAEAQKRAQERVIAKLVDWVRGRDSLRP